MKITACCLQVADPSVPCTHSMKVAELPQWNIYRYDESAPMGAEHATACTSQDNQNSVATTCLQ
jgi:hypothetical protein